MSNRAGWTQRTVADCLVPISFRSKRQIQTREYQAHGRFPIIDQSQQAIAGWTDDASAVIDAPLPVVVFGDHSRTLKYVDFPFVRGADGTQVMVAAEWIDPKFFYYACTFINVPARGYNRHFGQLKESSFALPTSLEAQKAISSALRLVEEAVSQEICRLKAASAIKRTAMTELFSRGLYGQVQKESEVGLIPQGWQIEPLATHFAICSGGTPSRGSPIYWEGGSVPWVKTTEVDYCVINDTEEKITAQGLAESAAKLLPPDTLLMAMYGQGVTRGKVAILGIEAACNQACAAMTKTDDVIDHKYLYHFLTWRYEAIRQLAHGGQQQNLNLDIVRALPVAFPLDAKEQLDICAVLDAIDARIDLHRNKHQVLETLFQALLHKLMTGEIDVNDLDLSALDREAEVAA